MSRLFFGGEIAGESTGGDLSQGIEISAGVSHAEGQFSGRHLTDTSKDELTGVTTPPHGKRREQCEVLNKAASDFNLEDSQLQQLRTDEQGTREHEVFRQLAEKLLIGQKTELLNQKELQAEATRVEAEAEADRQVTAAKAEADRQVTAAKAAAEAVADRLRAESTLAKAASDREVARERLLLRNWQDRMILRQQYLAGTMMDRSNIPEHMGTLARGENTMKSKNAQDQSSTAGRLGWGLIFPQDLGWPSSINIDAQRTQ